jgi:hypothetical protein
MSLIGALRTHCRTLALAGAMLTMLSGVAVAQDDPNPGALTFTGAMDFSNAYFYRGIRQETDGVVMWPAADLGLAAYSGEGGLKSVGVNVGVWNSLHTGPSGSQGGNKVWYEGDFYATLGLGFGGGVSFATTYTAYTSPKNAFTTVKEIMFKLAVDDSSMLGKGAVKPYVAIAQEFDTAAGVGQADGGAGAGTYMELGVAPGWTSEAASLAFPIKVGLSLSDYYEVAGSSDTFGYFSVAGTVTVPIKTSSNNFGSWNVHGGVEFQKYGGTLKTLNRAAGLTEDQQVIVSGGVGFTY